MIEIILTSSVLILLLAVLRRVLRGRISPWVQYALWLLVAARLLIPGTLFTSPVSVVGAAEDLQTSLLLTEPATAGSPAGEPGQSADGPSAPVVTLPTDGPTNAFTTKPAAVVQAEELLDLVWKVGIAVIGGGMVLSNLVFYFRLRRRRRQLALPTAAWSGNLPVYEADGLLSPCLFGLLRPAIYLNEAAMDAEHPEHILAHEYAHYRHGDHVWAVLRCMCLAIHWYNPLVWWAAALCRQDCELACDAAALKRLGEAESIDYGQTLLRMVSRGRNPSALLHTATTMTAGKRAMKERIALIIKQPRMRKVTLAAVVLLACLLTVCTFGGKAEASTEPENEPEEDVAAAVQPEETADPGQDAMQENARSIVAQGQSGADVSEWLPLMNYMDWGVLAQAAVEAGIDEGDGSMALINIMDTINQYIERQGPFMTQAEYLYLLSSVEGLDGAPAEGYAYTLYRMYNMNPSQFAYVVLEMLPEAQRNEALHLFCFEWYYHRISDSPEVPTQEEAIAQLEADLEAGISATPSEEILYSAGSTFQFRLVNGSGIYALTYTSSDTSVAEVDENGVVTAVGPGEAAISLHYEGAGGPLDFACQVRCEWEDTPAEPVGAVNMDPTGPSDALRREWQQAFAEYAFNQIDVPTQGLVYDDQSPYGLRDAVISSLTSFYEQELSLYPASDRNDRVNRIILETELPSDVLSGDIFTVGYQVEFSSEQKWNGRTYQLVPQRTDHYIAGFQVTPKSEADAETARVAPLLYNAGILSDDGVLTGKDNWTLHAVEYDILSRVNAQIENHPELSGYFARYLGFSNGGADFPETLTSGDSVEITYYLTFSDTSEMGPYSTVYTFRE